MDKSSTLEHNPRQRRQAFGDALAEALNLRQVTQIELGRQVGGITQSAVSAWKAGESVPDADLVFQVETVLDLPPGWLSRHLGYQPLDAKRKASSVSDAVMEDPLLDETGKRACIALYRELTRQRPPKGRPKR